MIKEQVITNRGGVFDAENIITEDDLNLNRGIACYFHGKGMRFVRFIQ